MNELVVFGAKYLIAVPVVVLLAYMLFSRGSTLRLLLWLSAFSLPIAFMLGKIASLLYSNPRPFVVGNFTPLVAHAADNGFPSDHTLLAATIASIIFFVDMRAGIFLWAVACGIGASRVLAGVHHSVDIFASMVIACIAVGAVRMLVSRFSK